METQSENPKLRVAVLATDGFEESELTEPVRALREDGGYLVDIIAPHDGKIQAFRHHDRGIQVHVNRQLDEVKPDEYDALLLPGGALNADFMRAEPKVLDFVQAMAKAQRPFAVICHAPWILASAGLTRGQKLTSYHTIKDDLVNAGAQWSDEEVVVDGNWVTSRQPKDLPAFIREMKNLFGIARSATRKAA